MAQENEEGKAVRRVNDIVVLMKNSVALVIALGGFAFAGLALYINKTVSENVAPIQATIEGYQKGRATTDSLMQMILKDHDGKILSLDRRVSEVEKKIEFPFRNKSR